MRGPASDAKRRSSAERQRRPTPIAHDLVQHGGHRLEDALPFPREIISAVEIPAVLTKRVVDYPEHLRQIAGSPRAAYDACEPMSYGQ